MQPTLFIFSGLPASGKSTLSKFIAKKYNAAYLRIDTVEQSLRDLCKLNVYSEGYELSYRIASDNLKIGNNVVADSCNSIARTRKEWEEVAKMNNSLFINIQVICSDMNEHQKRVETRTSEIEGLLSPTWKDIKNREFQPWTSKVITIDTANKSIETSLTELNIKIQKYSE